ncbi:hypothetical protein PRZ48_012457 [Zasmidium cellare]|uniref:F-box domain-containing protein n=1 Tax=Zasmidium cellare TaxID=395010 RepID=A0ABR0E4Y8_ZASCE|nr:hypothetical protein PRZ48_012457 [Zasmidium cellare]
MASAPQSAALPESDTGSPDTSTSMCALTPPARLATSELTFDRASTQADGDDIIPAVDQVFSTTELLEMILLNLPLFDLFVLQRTCKTFRDTIHGSIKLKQHMFLAPKTTKTTEWNPLMGSLLFQPKHTSEDILKGYLCARDQNRVHLLEYTNGISGKYTTFCEVRQDIRCCHPYIDQEKLDRPIDKSQAKRALSVQSTVKESWRDLMMAHTASKSVDMTTTVAGRSNWLPSDA